MSVLSTVLSGWLVLNGVVLARSYLSVLGPSYDPIVPLGPSKRSCASCALACAPTPIARSWKASLEEC
jgi:hypothetical protein